MRHDTIFMGALDQNFENGIWCLFMNTSAIKCCNVEVAQLSPFEAPFRAFPLSLPPSVIHDSR